ncbi:MAG: alpha/beta fold hydrolase [Parvularculaceae bacterium]|nr:alpha/beta fold hydrolase [Parvularculaceae bacterium]
MKTFVLVHGAWHGAWAWSRVRPLLEAAGSRVFAPTLAGLGERARRRDPVPTLDEHVEDVVALLTNEDLNSVTLVGHSYGGMAITGAADGARGRIASLIYLDAAVPRDGETMVTQKPDVKPAEAAATGEALKGLAPDGVWMSVLPLDGYGYHGLSNADAQWISTRLTPHPLQTWLEPILLRNGGCADLPRAYIHCNNPPLPMSSMPSHAAKLKIDPAWRYAEIPSGHGAMLTSPEAVARALLAFA